MAQAASIAFVVSGVSNRAANGTGVSPTPPSGLPAGTVKHSVHVAVQRGGGGEVRIDATPGDDVVVLHLAGGPSLVLHPENARDLLRAQEGVALGRSASERAGAEETAIPPALRWSGLEAGVRERGVSRGIPGEALLAGVDIVTTSVEEAAAHFAASAVVRAVDAQVDPGIYALSPGALRSLKGTAKPLAQMRADADGRLLVFVHGTFSDTKISFDRLWADHPRRVASLFRHYHDRVYALDHATLSASPIDNALMLARACPVGARLHLITFSRGGLVAEVLARVCADPKIEPKDLAFFPGTPYAKQRAALHELAETVVERRIRVDRIVRVGCPSRGTLLASKRLDAYVSVFKWGLELAGVPVAPALVRFLGEVARRREDPATIPGLEAQMPDSPLLRWLHASDLELPGDLRVIAGDIEGDSVITWLKTLLADAYFWIDNDLIVQTRSMYGGAPRKNGATFVFDQGGSVSHFNYFRNRRTAEAVVSAAIESAPRGFRRIGPLSWSGESSGGVRAAARAARVGPQSDKPAVFLLPGILGSNLKVGDERIWLSWRFVNGLDRLEYTPGHRDDVAADGPIELLYDDLADFLARSHAVIDFAFDWRLPMEDEARRLAASIAKALDERETSGQPVRIIAHSMGGLIARAMQLERPDVWQRMMAKDGARLLMLGTPNGGSWAPMQVLSGDDPFGNALAAFGALFQDHKARTLMATLPGFIQLQAALVDDARALDREQTWQQLADADMDSVRRFNAWHHNEIQLNVYRWGIPPQRVIDQAVALRERLNAQLQRDLDPFKDKMLLVVGRASFTPDGYESGERGLEYVSTSDGGDGRVTLASARLPGVRTWQVDCEHGRLPAFRDAFPAYFELLTKGTTRLAASLLDVAPSRGRAATRVPSLARSRPSRMRSGDRPLASELDVFETVQARANVAETTADAPTDAGFDITVTNGDLMFVREPLLLGHYSSLRLTGTEAVVDRLLGNVMSASLAAGLYPDAPGATQVFLNIGVNRDDPVQLPRPEAAIVVGLGPENELDAPELVLAVCQGVIAWSQRLTEKKGDAPATFDLASTLIGSGGVRMAVGEAARLIAQGVRVANERLASIGWPVVRHLRLVELYLDRASDVWRALQVQATAAGPIRVSDAVKSAPGALPRLLDSGYRGADYDFISALTREMEGREAEIAYTLDTKRARSEIRAQRTQSGLVRQLVSSAATDRNADPQIGRTLFKLLVPLEVEPFLGGSIEMQLEVDPGTAGIPWELLDTGTPAGGDRRPWAIRARLLRKLRIEGSRVQVSDASADASALVIGEPQSDRSRYPRLPGARREAQAVADALAAADALGAGRVISLVSPDDPALEGPDARTVLNALFERDWRIVHIAGHGEPPRPGDREGKGEPGGVVLSEEALLGPREIGNLRTVPQLVFVNCCHLAAGSADELLRSARLTDPPRFAANVAEELIKIGVRCVIAAGWAVEDEAAVAFADAFYAALLKGRRFIEAVAEARQAAWELGGNTWAAYQCYGDPDWRFAPAVADAQRPAAPLSDTFAGIASWKSLVLALESIAVQSEVPSRQENNVSTKLTYLESRFAERWGDIGEVAEGFGRAWSAIRDHPKAIRWYKRAVGASDGTASLKAIEQLGNLQARHAWAEVEKALRARARDADGPRESAGNGSARRRKRSSGGKSAPVEKRAGDLDAARAEIAQALELLERVTKLYPTPERESMCGSAWKRMALLEAAAADLEKEAQALANMRTCYESAEKLTRANGGGDLFYPVLNRMAAELIVEGGKKSWPGFDPAALAEVRANLIAKARDDPDFWSVVQVTELRLYEAIAARKLAGHLKKIVGELDDLHTRVKAATRWASVLDQLGFVLPRYQARANAEERKAVEQLTLYLSERAQQDAT